MARKRLIFLLKLQSILIYFGVGLSLTLILSLMPISVWANFPAGNQLTPNDRVITAPQLIEEGRLFYEAGQFDRALNSWEKATAIYRQRGDEIGISGSLINQARALSAMGLSRRACKTATQALKLDDALCDANPNPPVIPPQQPSFLLHTGLQTLGDILRSLGNFESAKEILQQNWEIAQQLSSEPAKGATLLSLGNVARVLGNRERDRTETLGNKPFSMPPPTADCTTSPQIISSSSAIAYYQQAIGLYQQATTCYPDSTAQLPALQAQLNRLSLLVEIERGLPDPAVRSEILKLLEIQGKIADLPPSHEAIYTKINYARSLASLSFKLGIKSSPLSEQNIEQLLQDSIQQSQTLADKQALAYAIGNLGWLYELTGRYSEALDATQRALQLARDINSLEIMYQWEWQLGRILNQQKQPELQGAKAAYESASNTLQAIRKNLTAVNKDAQFSFRDDVEPFYRQFVNLILTAKTRSEPSPENLQQAIKQIDELQLAELENFLGCQLGNLAPNNSTSPLEQIANRSEQITQTKAALIYPILLEDRVALLFKLPNQSLKYHETLISQQEAKKKLRQLRNLLIVQGVDIDEFNQLAQEIYGWILQPLEESLKKSDEVETLVFVLDGELRNIPMAVLYDGQEYLVQKDYSLAIAPSLQLIKPKPRSETTKVLLGGIEKYPSEGKFSFPNLKIEQEQLQPIQKEVAASEILLNTDFTKKNLQTQLQFNNFSTIHLATHGQFSSNPEETFIVGYNELIKANDLQELIQSSSTRIELLVLSACETAQGDNRAILGLAGLTVQSGAGSTISTLWKAPTVPTNQLVVQLYQELKNPQTSAAKALHLAQKALFDIYLDSPYNWASYTLVGNWL
ncbi:CHAT domain-containing protein [Limnofasciculus baicalensis]|uniref:CHAT domain-containing protein n=1 Tax=Limnofasciculus baicalensis BBK-W-15 TaxID=2699891 RepID=A0AAE3KUQ7_9CYAN|nr:CHAT domain-containing protein [Limnofasciculus baicalensis]MCP2731777.1 CHAT domain-containing protein [Limnofasciculus baicalensis BBK-W-15]